MIKELLRSPRTFASPVLLYLVSVLGEDVVTYEPETIAEYLRKLEPKVSRGLIDRVVAATGLFTTNAFWYDPATFNIVSRALNRKPFPTAGPADLEDMAWGVAEASLLTNGEDSSDNFSEYIIRYVKYYMQSNGVYTAPDSLSFVGSIPFTPALDDDSNTLVIQEMSDRRAAETDILVNSQMLELLRQLKSLQLPIRKEAAADLDELIKEYSTVLQ
jgi:hypothetical protein